VWQRQQQQRRAVKNNATADCNDGTLSYSTSAKGTCSQHGGVKKWINCPGNWPAKLLLFNIFKIWAFVPVFGLKKRTIIVNHIAAMPDTIKRSTYFFF